MASANPKKRKRNVVLHQETQFDNSANTSKPSAVFRPSKGRSYTLSIALPGSIVANALTHDLKTALAGQVARAAAVFCVDEIVVFNDGQSHKSQKDRRSSTHSHYRQESREGQREDGHTGWADPDYFLYHLLTYLETPPHLRKTLFPIHPNLRTAGALPSLDMPHHMRPDEWCPYREGVTVDPAAPPKHDDANYGDQHKRRKPQPSAKSFRTFVDAGLPALIALDTPIPLNTRVTLKFDSDAAPSSFSSPPPATAVAPSAPREEAGYYWGYTTRMASSLSAVFTESPFDEGYDLSLGTSERGVPLSSLLSAADKDSSSKGPASLPDFSHLLVVFGGVAGLESAASSDTELLARGITHDNVGDLFDAWVNVLPGQGSRTIRTEEAVWVALMGLREFVQSRGR